MTWIHGQERPLDLPARVLVILAGVLFAAEAASAAWDVFLLINWNLELYHTLYFSESLITDPIRFFLLVTAALYCFLSPRVVITKGIFPATLLIPYGMYMAYDLSKAFGRVGGGLLTYTIIGFLDGIGFILCALLIFAAKWVNDHKRQVRLQTLHG